MEITDIDLRDRTVIGADGNAIGQVVAVILDSDAWSVKAIRIKLRSNVAEQVGADHSLFRAGTIDVVTEQVQSVGDAVVLTISADGLRGAKETAPQQTRPPAS
jgi:sporulation protein YlmC with PRC-barrel domain